MNKSTQPKDPILSHSQLVKSGRPRLVVISEGPRWVKNGTLCVIKVIVDGVAHVYFTNNKDIANKFSQHIGQSVCLIASGNGKQGTDSMEIQPAGIPASELAKAPQSPQKATQEEIREPEPKDREAKVFLCQAANLMRLCVKKANDIAVELGLPENHRQGIATTLFIQADRQGHIFKMPVSAYSPDQLGWGASKADSLKAPQPEEDND
jgi:hypothetical protein